SRWTLPTFAHAEPSSCRTQPTSVRNSLGPRRHREDDHRGSVSMMMMMTGKRAFSCLCNTDSRVMPDKHDKLA
ncbi:unnamed protein product, partial [Amoebophrya sp. A120]